MKGGGEGMWGVGGREGMWGVGGREGMWGVKKIGSGGVC